MVEIEVLKLALSKEEEAIKLYQGLINEHPNLKDLLHLLINEEMKHKKMIENKIQQLSKY
jgi:rubrerythrin